MVAIHSSIHQPMCFLGAPKLCSRIYATACHVRPNPISVENLFIVVIAAPPVPLPRKWIPVDNTATSRNGELAFEISV